MGARAASEFGRVHPLARRVSRRLAPSVARAALRRLPASNAEVRVGKADQFRQFLIVLHRVLLPIGSWTSLICTRYSNANVPFFSPIRVSVI